MNTPNDIQEQKLQQHLAQLDFSQGDLDGQELVAEQQRSKLALRKKLASKDRPLSLWHYWPAAAAVLLVVISSLWFYKTRLEAETVPTLVYGYSRTAKGERKTVTLPDGSKVTLNSASLLKYPLSFRQRKYRAVELQGQGFFEVRPDASHPFIIQTPKLSIKVLDTSFDVNAYNDEPSTSVTVSTGKVSVSPKGKSTTYLLLSGDQLTYEPALGKPEKHRVDPEQYQLWQKGHYVFHDQELSEICRKLERAYGVNFQIQEQQLRNKQISFRIRGESINQIMSMLALAGDFDYIINKRTITLKNK